MKWLQQNNAQEDRRVGYTPTEKELRERSEVARKALFCVIPPQSHKLFQSHEQLTSTFFPYASTSTVVAAASAGNPAPVCPPCAACSPCAPCPAATPSPSIT